MTETSATTGPAAAGSWRATLADERTQPFPWWAFVITGGLGVLFGAAVLIWPDLTLRIMAALAGIWLLLVGLARILFAFLPTTDGLGQRVLAGIVGIVLLVAGLICLRELATRLTVLALMFSITWILGGVTTVIMGVQRHGAVRVTLITVGLLATVAGILLVATPSLSLATLILLTGVSSIVVGAGEVVMALVIRRSRG